MSETSYEVHHGSRGFSGVPNKRTFTDEAEAINFAAKRAGAVTKVTREQIADFSEKG